MVNGKNGADGDVDINVGRSIQRIHADDIIASSVNNDGLVVFFRDNQRHRLGAPEGRDEGVVGNHVQLRGEMLDECSSKEPTASPYLLDSLSLDISGSLHSKQIQQTRRSDLRGQTTRKKKKKKKKTE
jgi:hypothetical protein